MPYIARNAIELTDRNYIQFEDKKGAVEPWDEKRQRDGLQKPSRDKESLNLIYLDKQKARIHIKLNEPIPDGVLSQEDIKLLLSHGDIEEDFDIRHQPRPRPAIAQANMKPAGYEENK